MNKSSSIRVYKNSEFVGYFAKVDGEDLIIAEKFINAHIFDNEEERQNRKYWLLANYKEYVFI